MSLLLIALLASATAQLATNSIYDNVAAESTLSTLKALLDLPNQAVVKNALSGPGNFTLFAPNNAAFTTAGVDPATIADNADLTALLLYHALGLKAASTDLAAAQFPATLLTSAKYVNLGAGNAQTLGVFKTGSNVQVSWGLGSASVTQADIMSSNGYIHVINTVESIPLSTAATADAAGLTTLISALNRVNLLGTVNNTARLTIFAPTNAAFTALGLNLAGISNVALSKILTYHVVAGVAHSSDLSNGQVLTTLQGENLTVTVGASSVTLTDSRGGISTVSTANVLTVNGVVHVVNQVLLPSSNAFTVAENVGLTPALSILNSVISDSRYAAIYSALNSTSSSLTLFAPDDTAFENAGSAVNVSNVDMTSDVLKYHVVGAAVASTQLTALQFPSTLLSNPTYVNFGTGKTQVVGVYKNTTGVFVNFGIPGVATSTAQVVSADLRSSNGYIHVINRVESFPASTSATATAAGLTELVEALVATGLASVVDSTANLTIFAPTNAALVAAGAASLDNKTLTDILKYHVISNVYRSVDLVNGQKLKTLLGQDLTINTTSFQVNAAKSTATIIVPDALTINAVVHVIDTVLLPGANESSALAAAPMAALLAALLFVVRLF